MATHQHSLGGQTEVRRKKNYALHIAARFGQLLGVAPGVRPWRLRGRCEGPPTSHHNDQMGMGWWTIRPTMQKARGLWWDVSGGGVHLAGSSMVIHLTYILHTKDTKLCTFFRKDMWWAAFSGGQLLWYNAHALCEC